MALSNFLGLEDSTAQGTHDAIHEIQPILRQIWCSPSQKSLVGHLLLLHLSTSPSTSGTFVCLEVPLEIYPGFQNSRLPGSLHVSRWQSLLRLP